MGPSPIFHSASAASWRRDDAPGRRSAAVLSVAGSSRFGSRGVTGALARAWSGWEGGTCQEAAPRAAVGSHWSSRGRSRSLGPCGRCWRWSSCGLPRSLLPARAYPSWTLAPRGPLPQGLARSSPRAEQRSRHWPRARAPRPGWASFELARRRRRVCVLIAPQEVPAWAPAVGAAILFWLAGLCRKCVGNGAAAELGGSPPILLHTGRASRRGGGVLA